MVRSRRILEVTDCFTPLQLDVLHVLFKLYAPYRADPSRKRARMQRGSRPSQEAFRLLPIGTLIAKPFRGRELQGQVCDYCGQHWRAHYEDNDWENICRREVAEFKGGQRGNA